MKPGAMFSPFRSMILEFYASLNYLEFYRSWPIARILLF